MLEMAIGVGVDLPGGDKGPAREGIRSPARGAKLQAPVDEFLRAGDLDANLELGLWERLLPAGEILHAIIIIIIIILFLYLLLIILTLIALIFINLNLLFIVYRLLIFSYILFS